MGFREWMTGKKNDSESDDDLYKAIRMTLRDFNFKVSPSEGKKELDRLFTQAAAMYGAANVNNKLSVYRKRLGI